MDTGEQLLNSTSFGTVPFKVMSAVNPTRYVFDFRRAGRICPSILKPIRPMFRATDVRSFVRFAYNALGASTNEIDLTIRITTFVDILPQDNLIPVIPFPASRTAQVAYPSCTERLTPVPQVLDSDSEKESP